MHLLNWGEFVRMWIKATGHDSLLNGHITWELHLPEEIVNIFLVYNNNNSVYMYDYEWHNWRYNNVHVW